MTTQPSSRLQQLLVALSEMVDAYLALVAIQVSPARLQIYSAAGTLASAQLDGRFIDLDHCPTLKSALEHRDARILDAPAEHRILPADLEAVTDSPADRYTMVMPFHQNKQLQGGIVLETPRRVKLGARLVRTLKNMADVVFGLLEDELRSPEGSVTTPLRNLDGRAKSAVVGQSAVWLGVLDKIRLVAPTTTPVLISGETGTGKEQLAKAIHEGSDRAGEPFIALNCSVLIPELALSELFGHEKGSFTGADRRRLGRFELAEKGTLFLDEIGELPAVAQAQLLRVLQEWTFERVGGTAKITADVRLIAATHRNLVQLMQERMFRDDLYYRLNVFPIQVPALRERKGDIRLLAEHIVERMRDKFNAPKLNLSDQALRSLDLYAWPGNVRELCNVLERGAILSAGGTICRQHLQLRLPESDDRQSSNGLGLADSTPPGYCSPESLTRMERAVAREIFAALLEAGGRIAGSSGAAALLGVPPSTLQSTIKRLGLRSPRNLDPRG